jgi:uncharacterized membrane protein YccF (DUF307 family)
MSFLGNLLWVFIGGGIVIWFEYLVAALLLACTIIGIPFAVQCLKLAGLGLLPFGKEIGGRTGAFSTLLNIVWLFTAGLVLALTHLMFALLCAMTIIGLPFAKQHLKLCGLALMPFGKEIVDGRKLVAIR